MPKERRPGWRYYYSEILGEEFAIHIETGWVYFAKGARYSPDELNIIEESGRTLEPEVHRVKTLIGGDIVANKVEDKKPPPVKQGELAIF
jgi:hypothetical protein